MVGNIKRSAARSKRAGMNDNNKVSFWFYELSGLG